MSKEKTLPLKTCASEAHKEVIQARNIGVMGIVTTLLVIIISVISFKIGSIAGMIGIGIIGFFTAKRAKRAEYLENAYGLKPKPIIPTNKQPKKLQEGFKIWTTKKL